MQKSESIELLAKSLNQFQSKFSGVEKSAVNPYFRSKYATLDAIQIAISPMLGETGLSYVHSYNGDGTILITRIMHMSGQYMDSYYPAVTVKKDPQGVGSADTYAARRGLCRAFGIPLVEEDDDGEEVRARASVQKPPETKKPIKDVRINIQMAIRKLLKEKKISDSTKLEIMRTEFGVTKAGDMTQQQLEKFKEILENE